MREAEFRSLVCGCSTHRDTRHRPPSPAGVNLWRFNQRSGDASGLPRDCFSVRIGPRYRAGLSLPKSRLLNPNVGESLGEWDYLNTRNPLIYNRIRGKKWSWREDTNSVFT